MVLSWGKPTIKIKPITGTGAAFLEGASVEGGVYTFPDAKEGTTALSTSKGNKVEATVEGGEVEAVRYDRSKYSLAWTIRNGEGRALPFANADGFVAGEWEVTVTPENAAAPGFKIPRTTLSVEDTWNAADGGEWVITADALKPSTGSQLQWAVNPTFEG